MGKVCNHYGGSRGVFFLLRLGAETPPSLWFWQQQDVIWGLHFGLTFVVIAVNN